MSISNLYIVARFSKEVVQPKVVAMDEAEKLDPQVLNGLFENGVSDRLC